LKRDCFAAVSEDQTDAVKDNDIDRGYRIGIREIRVFDAAILRSARFPGLSRYQL
jgi:hypothetical protein